MKKKKEPASEKWNEITLITFFPQYEIYTRWMTTTRWNSTCNDSSSQRARLWLWSGKIKKKEREKKKRDIKTTHNTTAVAVNSIRSITQQKALIRRGERSIRKWYLCRCYCISLFVFLLRFFYILEILFFIFYLLVSSSPFLLRLRGVWVSAMP